MEQGLTYQLKWAWSLTRNHRGTLVLYFFLELFAIALSLLFIYCSKLAVDHAVNQEGNQLKTALIISVASVVVGLAIRSYGSWLNKKARIRILIYLQNILLHAQMRSLWKVTRKWKTGDIQVRIQKDCTEIVEMISYGWINALLTGIRLIASFGFLWIMDPMLALLIVAISPLLLFSKLYFRTLKKLNLETKMAESHFGHVILENLRFRNIIRALNLFELRWEKTQESQESLAQLKVGLVNFSTGSQLLMKLAVNAGFLVTFIWSTYRLYKGEISFGTLTAFLQLVSRIQSPILSLMSFVPQFIRFRTAVSRVLSGLQVAKEPQGAPVILGTPQKIRFHNLSFRYEDNLVISRLNGEIFAGDPVALLGSSGRGKTTIIRMLLCLIYPHQGEIQVIHNQKTHRLSHLHRINFAYVPQGSSLFSGTIRENIAVNQRKLSKKELDRALYLACAEFVYDLPSGLDTYIGESGYGLSEGQAQRIAVARAMIRECSIWLFDEITAGLDSKTANTMLHRLFDAGKDKIILFVTHDMKLAQKCTKTIYI